MLPLVTALLALPLPQVSVSSAPLRPAFGPHTLRRPLLTWVTGEVGPAHVIFRVTFDPRTAGSAEAVPVILEPRGGVDGIDFVPGTPSIVVGMPTGILSHYDLPGAFALPDLIPDTDLIAVPPATPGTHPSTVWSTPSHVYYVENQFGFGATVSHRIVRKPFSGGPEEVVYDGAAHGLVNFEGLEGFGGRLYFFAKDPGKPSGRALLSVELVGGIATPAPPAVHLGGLFEAPFGMDGSDELDFDPVTGLIFGTNIVNGEVIAWEPLGGFEVSSPGAMHFVDGAQVAASSGALAALGGEIDGVRSAGDGWLVFTGKSGVIVSLDAFGVLADGADDGDARVLLMAPGLDFDDLTPVVPAY